ncbi:MAG: SDR family oxidoreductase [Planctomycetota bacterium]|jgi:non-ribosomal peptide synthase protein (TIGR01720 family)|nr:SDR family oxidoreductase [Planctomycetota bacterium]
MSTTDNPREWTGFEIAIIGMAGRFPGAKNVEGLWANLRAGVESISVLTDEELLAAGEDPMNLEDPAYVRAASKLADVDQFDAGFFGMTPREAELTDPQQRLFLEQAWVSLESAGYDPDRCPGPVGVFGGVSQSGYFIKNLLTNEKVDRGSLPVLFGNGNDFLATRVSYKLGLKGPAIDVQTSCSSSLVAVHLACQSLLAGECDMALAGGVGLVVPQGRGYLHQEQGIYSPDGHCRAFSAQAEGTVGGSGVALVTLRRLEDAIEAGDNILAVIKGSAINNDGADKVGYAAPSVDGQAEVVRSALAMADVNPESIGYIESHGTGTALGDPIEIAALTAAFREQTERTDFCRIGSIKTNMGHLDSAAGVAGLIKAALAVHHAQLPPSLHCDEPDPQIDFPSTPFRVQTELENWECEGPRRAGVSSFGIGGTNAHVIVEEPPGREVSEEAGEQQLIVLSARTSKALEGASAELSDFLEGKDSLSLADLAWTLQTGRKDFPVRRALRATDVSDLRTKLAGGEGARAMTEEAHQRSVVFLFPGQGAQYANMGRGLYESLPAFTAEVDTCCELLQPHLGLDLRAVLFPAPGAEEQASEQLKQTWLTQPALFVIEYALSRAWMQWGVKSGAMIGHSIGEYVAAALAGVFSLEDAIALVAARGKLMQDLPEGDMLAVSLPEAEVEPHLGAELSLAAVNEHTSCVVSGPAAAIAALAKSLEEKGVATRALHTSHAFHSAMMDPILDEFTERVRQADPQAPSLPFVSTLTGTWIREEEATDPGYWARHLRQTVRFADGLETLLEEPGRVYLEVGPGTTLSTLSTRIARKSEHPAGSSPGVFQVSMRHPREDTPDGDCLLDALGQLWVARVPIDWQAMHGGVPRRRVALPGYAFQRKRYWIEPGTGALAGTVGKKKDISDWFYQASWRRRTGMLQGQGTKVPERVLLLAEEGSASAELAEHLTGLGSEVICVHPGEAFTVDDGGGFSLRPGERTDYDALTGALMDQERRPDAVFHLWSLAAGSDDSLDRGFLSVLFLTQALASDLDLAVTIVTTGTADVLGDEALRPEHATLVGLARAITQEYKATRCRVIDWAGEASNQDLATELTSESQEELVVCRGAHRWVRWYEPVPVGGEEVAPMRSGSHTLVVGGLGSVGLEVARCLGAAEQAKLTLIGRSSFPGRHAWDEWVDTHEDDDETSHAILILRELENGGSEVNVLQADVTDPSSLAAAVQIAEAQFGSLSGAVHAAGAAKNMALLQDTTREQVEEQLHPKVAGLKALEEVLGDRALDFCLIQSSLASCMGVYGMVGYVAAHDWVDTFVTRHNRNAQTQWMSVNWDHWLTWKEPEFLHDQGDEALYMERKEGAEAMRRVLALPAGTQLLVSTGDLQARIEGAMRGGMDLDSADLHERPDLASDYQAPSTPAEQVLVAAWGEVLGIAQIGVHDNFFELGGDSVIGLQVVSKVAQQGFKVVPAQIFEHPTIAGLAGVAQSQQVSQISQGEVSGDLELLPIQHWFFEQQVPTPDHFNLPMLFNLSHGAQVEHVQAALDAAVAHHDGLRARFCPEGNSVSVCHSTNAGGCEVEVVDLSSMGSEDASKVVASRAAALHGSLDMQMGPIMKAALFTHGQTAAPELLWVIHHLVVDVVSWRILMEDFQTALGQFSKGEELSLPPKTTSLQDWTSGLKHYATSEDLTKEREFWSGLAEAKVAPLGVDFDNGPNDTASSRTLRGELDTDMTKALLQDVPGVYGTRMDEVLLTALVRGMKESTGVDQLLVDLEGHGREDVVQGADLSRTVGWLTTLYPGLVSSAGCAGPGEALKQVKEQVRSIPHRGIGFGVLRYLSEDASLTKTLAALPVRDINFLYLGQFGSQTADEDGTSMRLLEERSGEPCNPKMLRAYLLESVVFVSEGKLHLELSYSENRHEKATAQGILDAFLAALIELIEHCKNPTAGGHTPSDFPGARVSQASLDKLLSKIGRKGPGSDGTQ